jgi:hypothetical protein
MKNKLDDAFTDHPPILADGRQLKPLSEMVYKSILAAGREINNASDMTWAGLYVMAATLPTFEAAKRITSPDAKAYAHAACMDLSEGEYDEIVSYMDRVIDRRNAAQIEVEESPGKPQPEDVTSPAT